MKSLKMARNAPLWGVVALCAVSLLAVIGCEIDPNADDEGRVAGTLEIQKAPGFDDFYVGTKLTAKFSGERYLANGTSPAVEFKWYKSGSGSKLTEGVTGDFDDEYTPTAEDRDSTVRVEVTSLKDTKLKALVSEGVKVVVYVYYDFLGTWEMIGEDQTPDFTGGDTKDNDETIVITSTKFRLDSTFAGRTGNANDKYTDGLTPGHDYDTDHEYLEFVISSWGSPLTALTVVTKAAAADGNNTFLDTVAPTGKPTEFTPNLSPTPTYLQGLKLTVACTAYAELAVFEASI